MSESAAESFKTIHVGISGRGAWPLEVLHDAPDTWQPVALVDVNRDALHAAAASVDLGDSACYESLDAALEGKGREADGVVVITPSALHGRFVRAALEAGKHVLVEKPLVHRLDEAQALVALAEERGLALVVAQNYRYKPLQRRLRQAITSSEFGVPGYATFVHHRYRPEPRAFTMPHSMLVEMSVHHFDDFRSIFGGDPLAITARSFNPPWSRYPGEAAVQALIEWELPGNAGFTLAYTGTFTSATTALTSRIEFEGGAVTWEGNTLAYLPAGSNDRQPIELPPRERAEELDVAAAWRRYAAGGDEPPISGRNNLGTIRMIEAAIRSAETGQRVPLSELA